MAKPPKNCSELTAASLLLLLRRYGGSAPLHSINFSQTVIHIVARQRASTSAEYQTWFFIGAC